MKKSFELNWNWCDPNALDKAYVAVEKWIRKNQELGTTGDFRIRDMIVEMEPEMYAGFSRGDKCRVGRALSTMYNNGYLKALQRGAKKGATNTYHLVLE